MTNFATSNPKFTIFMKRFFIAMFAVVMGLAITTSCKQKSEPAEGEEKAQVEEAQKNPEEVLTDLIASAKAEGANWSVEQWQDAMRKVVTALKPMLVELNSITSGIDENSTAEQIAEAMEKAEKMQEKYGPLTKLMDEFDEVAKSFDNGKAVIEDDEFSKQLQKELGLEDLDL